MHFCVLWQKLRLVRITQVPVALVKMTKNEWQTALKIFIGLGLYKQFTISKVTKTSECSWVPQDGDQEF